MRAYLPLIAALTLPLFAVASEDAEDVGNSEVATAIQTVIESSQKTIRANQTDRTAPNYPPLEARNGREAWVHVTYCIDEAGVIQNVSVLDSVGNKAFDKAAIDAVEQWQYEPAVLDGKPIWQSRNEVYVSFSIETVHSRRASRKFVRRFHAIGDHIEAQRLAEADSLFRKVYEDFDLSLYELAKLWAQRVRYEGLIGDMYRLDMALHRATASHGEWIDNKSYIQLLDLLVKVELNLGKYHEAVHSFEDLVDASDDENEQVAALRPTIEQVLTLINGENILEINAEIRTKEDCNNCDDSWHFTPVRNEFSLTNVVGTVTSIDMRCDHKRYEALASDNVEWHIPESWGTCAVQIYGEPGTTFNVLMLPTDNS